MNQPYLLIIPAVILAAWPILCIKWQAMNQPYFLIIPAMVLATWLLVLHGWPIW